MKVCACIVTASHCTLFGRLKDVQGCSAAPEDFSPTAFLALFLFRGSQRVWGEEEGWLALFFLGGGVATLQYHETNTSKLISERPRPVVWC